MHLRSDARPCLEDGSGHKSEDSMSGEKLISTDYWKVTLGAQNEKATIQQEASNKGKKAWPALDSDNQQKSGSQHRPFRRRTGTNSREADTEEAVNLSAWTDKIYDEAGFPLKDDPQQG